MRKFNLTLLFYILTLTSAFAQAVVGKINGELSVSPTGAAVYTIPIELQNGANDFTPSLSLVYNSQNGNGIVGYGWDISGLSSISVITKNIYFDGHAEGVHEGRDNAYALDGMRLLLKSGQNGELGAVYQQESENYSIIEITETLDDTPATFRVKTTDGTTYYYGSRTGRVRYTDSSSYQWYLDYAVDRYGNYIEYRYVQQGLAMYIDQILYGRNINNENVTQMSVRFLYENRGDEIPIHLFDANTSINKRLSCIECSCGTIYNKYTLEYQTSTYSHLSAVTQYGTGASHYAPTTFTWSDLPGINISTENRNVPTLQNKKISSQCFTATDIDNDGKSELVSMFYHSFDPYSPYSTFYTTLYKKNTNGNFNQHCTYSTQNVVDFNDDLFQKTLQGGCSGHFTNSSNSTLLIPYFERNSGNYQQNFHSMNHGTDIIWPLKAQSNNKPCFFFCDIDRDGMSEIVLLETALYNGKYSGVIISANMSSGTMNYEEFSLQMPSKPTRILVLDLNNDGADELFVTTNSGYYVFYQNNGTFSNQAQSHGTEFGNCDILEPGDFDGDGNIDFVIKKNNQQSWLIAYNEGGQEISFMFHNIETLESLQAGNNASEKELYCFAQDIDCDGKSDVIVGFPTYYNHRFVEGKLLILQSAGYQMNLVNAKVFNTSSTFPTADRIVQGDFNGDGYAEILYYDGDANADSPATNAWKELWNGGLDASSNRIVAITDGLSATDSISYAITTDETVYANDRTDTYPLYDMNSPIPVVQKTATHIPGYIRSKTYSYKNAICHLAGKGFLGFTDISTSSNDETSVEQKYTLNTDYYVLYPSTTDIKSTIDENVIRNVTNYVNFEPEGDNSYFMRTDAQYSTDETVYRNMKNNYSYDYGVPVRQEIRDAVYAKESESVMWESTNPNVWLKGLPQETTTIHSNIFDINEYNTTEDYVRDPANGNVLKKTKKINGNVLQTELYEYNVFGKVTRHATVYGTSTDTLVTQYTYSATTGLLSSKRDPDGQLHSYTYDTYRRISRKNDQWSTTTNYTYDGMHRLLRENNSVNPAVYTYANSTYPGACYKKTTQKNGGPITEEHFNAMGMKVADGEKRFDGRMLYTDYIYYENGLLKTVSLPHFTARVSNSGTHFYYDNMRRKIREVAADGNVSTWEHNQGVVTSEINGIRQTDWMDLPDLSVATITDNGYVDYEYNPDGQLNAIYNSTNTSDFVATFEYDNLLRLTQSTDMNGTSRNFTYDRNGYLQTTELSTGTHTTVHDKYGKVISETYADNGSNPRTYQYSYTTRNQLSTEIGEDYVYLYSYDSYGRLTRKALMLDFAPQRPTIDYTYDSNGRITRKSIKILSSDNYDVVEKYTYQNGWCTAITVNDTIVWQLQQEDNLGRASQTSDFMNNSTFIYDSHGRILQYTINGHNSMSQTYTYDVLTGNLTSKNEIEYTYDSFNRLTSEDDVIYAYDANNNIENNSIGNYTYNDYRITSIEVNDNNMMPQNQIDILYSYSMERPLRISNNTYRAQISYDANRRRTQMLTYRNGTLVDNRRYFFDGCELSSVGNDVTAYYYAGGNPYDSKAVVKIKPNYSCIYQMYRDNVGSVVLYTNSNETINLDYNAWGVRKSDDGSELVHYGSEDDIEFTHTYTGHEYLPYFGLYNANARLYNPYIGRFLTPDPRTTTSGTSDDYNPYVYAHNNPLSYVDRNGEIAWFLPVIAGALLNGGIYSLGAAFNKDQKWTAKNFFTSMGIGAISGLLNTGIGTLGNIIGANSNYGLKLTFGILSQTTNTTFSHAISGEKMSLKSIPGILFGSTLNSVLPLFSPKSNSNVINGVFEIGYNTVRNGICGLGSGAINSIIYDDNSLVWKETKGAALSGFARTSLNSILFGAASTPPDETSRMKGVIYRGGGIVSQYFDLYCPDDEPGITLGRNLYVYDLNAGATSVWHENMHYIQINKMTLYNFYCKILSDYLHHGWDKGPLETEANNYEFTNRYKGYNF